MEMPWVKNYPPGVPGEVDVKRYKNIPAMFEEAIAKYGSRIAFECMGAQVTYAEFERLSASFAAHLAENGFKKGDRVALMMPNILQYPIALYGVLRLGCVVVNCNPLYTPRELEHQLKDSGATGIVVLENFATTLEKVKAATSIRHVIVTGVGDMLGLKGHLVNFVLRKVKKVVPAYSLPGHLRFSATLSNRSTPPKPAITLDDTACLQYTGGTTGVSKGAILTHGNLCANTVQVGAWLETITDPNRQEVLIGALPLYHIFALTACTFVFTTYGARIVLIPNPKDIAGFIKTLSKLPFSVLPGVNTLFNAMVNHPDFEKLDFSNLRLTIGGGMAVQRATAEKWKKVTGKPIVEAYGLTETSPGATINRLDISDYTGTIGMPFPSTQVTLRKDDGTTPAMGEPGEICIRGPQVMKGYYQRPEETEKVIDKDGWFASGDIGIMHPDGQFKIVDRKKDMILVSGFNVYPNEVEDAVAMHPGVLEVAAIAVPDEKSGEAVKICVVKKDPNLTEASLMEHCRTQLTGYKCPKHITFRESLPKTNVGKILRRELRDEELKQSKAA
jgi:long-chain acyl-CoA synthetase